MDSKVYGNSLGYYTMRRNTNEKDIIPNETWTNIISCQKIIEEDNEVVLIVSHGAACRQFMRYWQHTSPIDQKERLGNCCILKFEYENKEFKLTKIINHKFND